MAGAFTFPLGGKLIGIISMFYPTTAAWNPTITIATALAVSYLEEKSNETEMRLRQMS
ncbi:hypothetical protein JVT61DRAFT_7699 [Boletus reticuloceps]|uniref:Uncharacterized protein n=1 Tax=Boletus reticuloceps TaxID=495285 RepID=A0A8I3A619_9AGAM|nr:hypothetical protein JVT61DRAFT_8723 [Boletus reticuloceps]KAG6372586.1 hypothetical protein JVT61DRAFT_7699 [Boletus reticuloceps]